jgi:hypothetical protein
VLLLLLAIHFARSALRSNAWWQTRQRRFARFRQLRSVTSPDHQRAHCDSSKKSGE